MRLRLLLNWNSCSDILLKSYQTVIQVNKEKVCFAFFSSIISMAADLRWCKEVLCSACATFL